MEVHQELSGHNPPSEKLEGMDEEQVTAPILMVSTTVQQMLLCSNITQWVPLWPPGKARSASQSEALLPQMGM